MGKIYIIRHAQSIANEERRYSGNPKEDRGLSNLGKAQAQKIGEFFASKNIKHIYSSPFLRAQETANAIAKKCKVAKINLVDKFKEHECGDWNGKTELEIKERYPEAWAGWHRDPENNPIPGGETLREIQLRALPELYAILKKHAKEDVVIVTHYAVLNVLICSLIASLGNFRSFDSGNGTIAEFEIENVPRLKSYISHVDKLESGEEK